LESHLADGQKVGFSWGSTLQTIAYEYLPQKSYTNAIFIQLTGNIFSQSTLSKGYMDPRDLVQRLAKKANAKWSVFQVPFMVKNPVLRQLLLDDAIGGIIGMGYKIIGNKKVN
jgi:DNA-binding transcriptional regulator LsrR (DeoR family)